jgi:FixJ family two-component response regulator
MVNETDATIFVVDDDELVRDSLKILIMTTGLCVEAFGSAREFLPNAALKRCGLLILDVRMPGMTGLELQEQLTTSGSKMPVIFITAHEDPWIRKTALDRGAIAFFHKPVDDQMLFEAIDLALSRIA